ncbi:hypothetical protein NDU88_006807 [Pleurodeles waltl]|uniref:Uncharacterized protein n=1 Tax=Pleurodeles waltl TaxID=8319 RepID=A0AAV7NZ72_PLEWA|nr:hypothetical protein NDU88_006807 [Pleurodeles waltl]
MLAQMRSEALKRGKDWLCKKMEDTTPEGGPSLTVDKHAFTGLDIGNLQADREQTPKPNKQQKSMGKPARKSSKRTRDPKRDTASPLDPETPESSSTRKSTDGEHISAIIKECLKSITPLLLKSGNAGSGRDYTGKEKSQENHSKGEGSGAQAQGSDRASPGDPTPAWGMPNREIEPFKSVGLPPEAYTRPSLGCPAMTTRAAGLANAIPLTVKERVWRKEFIDIFSLLEIQLEGLDLTVCVKKDEDRRERKSQEKEEF